MGWQNGIARTGNQFALPQGVRLGILPVEPECPVDAIKPDTERGLEKWLVLNREYAERWPNITAKKAAPADADTYQNEKGKFDKYFSPKPGEGD